MGESLGGLGGAYAQANAIKAKADYDRRMAGINVQIADSQAKDAIARGDAEANKIKSDANAMIGSQRANMAAQGVVVDADTSLALQEETAALSAADAMRAKNNAWREAHGYKMEALNISGGSKFAQAAAKNEYRNTLITGGSKALASAGTAYATGGMSLGFGDSSRTVPSATKTAGGSYRGSGSIA